MGLIDEIRLELDRIKASVRALEKLLKDHEEQGRLDLLDAPKHRIIKHVLPEDWSIPVEEREWARRKHPRVDIDAEAEKFAAYWRANRGKRADWGQAFRLWVSRSGDFKEARPAGPGGGRAQPGERA